MSTLKDLHLAMSHSKDLHKILDVKIRPFSNHNSQERADQKGVSRVYLSKEALFDLKLESGQPCYLWKKGSSGNQKVEAIAWLASEKTLGKKALQMTRTFQETCGFNLADDVHISAAGQLRVAEAVVLRDVTSKEIDPISELKGEDKSNWEWFLKEYLFRADIVFGGMVFKDILFRGAKRTFVVESVNDLPNGQGSYSEASSSVKIVGPLGANMEPKEAGPKVPLHIANVAGVDQALKKLNRFLSNFDRQFKFTSAQRSCSVVLHGGHGTGKTFLINKVIATGWGKVHRIERSTKVAAIRNTFKDAASTQPSIIVIDELEKLVSKEDSVSEDVTAVLGDEMDKLVSGHSSCLPRVIVIAATLDIGTIPLSLRKRGRFSVDIPLPVPDAAARKAILKSLSFPIHPDKHDETLERIGDRTHAYTAEDLLSLLDTACEIAEEKEDWKEKETENPEESYYLAEEDIEQALLLIRPTAMHDITLRPPSVRWDEIGGQETIKKALRRAVETPLLHPERMNRLGASAKKGLLLYGPPGCSKTLSAQAMATESGFNFFAVKGAELLNMYVGESERAVRDIFARARAASPSVIFFDEIESIGSKREGGGRNSGVNVLTTLLNEMDGIETLKGVTVLAATNQPQVLDLALIRPGRFDQLLYVPPPDLAGREAIFRVKQRKMDMAPDVDIPELARLTEGHSGAELVGICQAACDEVLERCEVEGKELQIQMEDFVEAIKGARKGIAPEMIMGYERWARLAKGALF
ncbi:hypothetical protein HYFRA_00005570 [Hymenoscyphus fraxineus]|uniref:AAA+ ATPase domain-containing protein n=1 Tax=Hymenoscyphus fraxineus TaxID=746836 RepID=A0A9N9KRP6_9HELO|nr:hypothetical protein HYFRA_00005570 [Hymenoscyphus fraxineus]